MDIKFLGAAREVTGSKHLITTSKGKKILLDCGAYQGKGLETDAMNRNLGFEPSEIDYLILSHPHIDHSGLIPFIWKLGFRGTVFCTPATRDLCAIMLADSGKIQEADTLTFNKKPGREGMQPIEPIYTADDARKAMELFVSVPYNKELPIDEETTLLFTDNGHILGSATCNLKIKDSKDGDRIKRIAFSGDIGRYSKRILKEPQPFPQADYIIMESTYGDRIHSNITKAEQQLFQAVVDTCCKKKGKLIIPAFAVGRAQEIIFALNNLWNKGLLPKIDVFVDSPLSLNATNIMKLHTECFNEDVLTLIKTDPDPFGFDSLHYIQSAAESKKLNTYSRPCIIISASGMMEAGRVKHHLANNISNPHTTILVVGYCSPSTLGHRIMRGDKRVSIFGIWHTVRADIKVLDAYSAHGDRDEMLRWLACQDKNQVKHIFLVHGEEATQANFAQTLKDNGFKSVSIPKRTDCATL
ncbi:MAG: MBL fold metallo-hydrolase [Bacteroidales bacterium]|jgi:metallo-beta-lactamase family protein|nr:MBL fold metallo-hydrolase [Bacteroidales bacterium]